MRVHAVIARAAVIAALFVGQASAAQAPTPKPFPAPSSGQTTKPAPPQQPPPSTQKPGTPAAPATTAKPTAAPLAPLAPQAPLAPAAPDLGGIPLYPNAVYITSYDAGRGQRFHLYGVMLPYADAVNFYRTALKQKGDELFESPPTHQFEIGRFREQDMAFPPSVTVKDYTFGGSPGYVNPKGGTPERFPTIIQIVPLAAAR